VPTSLGAHNPRVAFARELLSKKGRREHGAFAFEGPTLLAEAVDAGVEIQALYATPASYETATVARTVESGGVPTYLVDERTMAKISGVETPSGLLAVAPVRLAPLEQILDAPGVVLVLADVGDPGNAGTLLRTAEAFGVRGAIFGTRGTEPHNPKVVRAAMGALFRMPVGVADPGSLRAATGEWQLTGLAAGREPLSSLRWTQHTMLLVGSERQGLGPWEPLCARFASIPMSGQAESLNAAVAGSIALYEATKHLNP
jgi:TrmH family RNA methyltransferase